MLILIRFFSHVRGDFRWFDVIDFLATEAIGSVQQLDAGKKHVAFGGDKLTHHAPIIGIKPATLCLQAEGLKFNESAMSDACALTTLTGYHGCDAASVEGIKTHHFRCSKGEHHWLGEGVYFFGSGISDPVEDAKRWAIAQSWDNERKCRIYNTVAVIQAQIASRKPFDMTKDEGKTAVNRARQALTKRMTPTGGYKDHEIIGWLARTLHFDVLIQDFFIQMTSERRLKIRSRYPNVRVICVREPNSAIDKGAIRVTYQGQIPINPQ